MKQHVRTFPCALLIAACLLPRYAAAQGQIVIDWPSQKLVSYPTLVNQRTTATVIVNNANDLLFQYQIGIVATPRALDDAKGLLALGASTGTVTKTLTVQNDCTAAIADLNKTVGSVSTAVAEIFDCTRKDPNGKYRSLKETVDEWNQRVKATMTSLAGGTDVAGSVQSVTAKCPDDSTRAAALGLATALNTDVDNRQRKIDAIHQVQEITTLDPDTDYKVTVTELCNGSPTGTPFTATFSPSSTILTLSLGTLLSGIQQRSYSSQKDPTNTAQNVLAVNGTGRFTPLGVALLNYEIPHAQTTNAGLTVSSGLVLKFGSSQVTASSFGWFGGLGFHIYHRLFLAAGANVGQFSDFPTGLQRGSVVPVNYGDLNGVNRSTARFAFSVTYQTKAFSNSATTPKTTQTAGGSAVAGGQ